MDACSVDPSRRSWSAGECSTRLVTTPARLRLTNSDHSVAVRLGPGRSSTQPGLVTSKGTFPRVPVHCKTMDRFSKDIFCLHRDA